MSSTDSLRSAWLPKLFSLANVGAVPGAAQGGEATGSCLQQALGQWLVDVAKGSVDNMISSAENMDWRSASVS